ncbi:integral membrane protein [alpha proteobacterium U9-1i]|nr:integral membrane protein [alpha proteobacterium U9-1i]
MEWLLILGLGFWVWLLWNRVDTLSKRVEELLRALKPIEVPPDQPEADPRGELLLDTPLPPETEPTPLWVQRLGEDREPLLLDTPLPPAANEEQFEAPPTAPAPPLEPLAEVPRPTFQQPKSARANSDRSFEQWLTESGLALLGGGAFILGVGFLVQQGLITPLMSLGGAALLGALAIAVSEWVRRGGKIKAFAHPLAASVLAGAGASALYASSWAAHGILNYIEWGWGAFLLALCALLLLGLSLLHGWVLGLFAILGAMLAPALAQADAWPSAALTLYVGAVAGAGFGVAALRRWPWVAAATLAGLYIWFIAAIAAGDAGRALLLASIASIGGAAMGLRKPLAENDGDHWSKTHAHVPMIATGVSSVLLLWAWLTLAEADTPRLDAAMLVGLFHVGLAAGAVRARVAHPAAFAAATGALVLGAMLFLQTRNPFGPLAESFYFWALAAAPLVGVAALAARADRHGRALVAGAGASGAAVIGALGVFSRDEWSAPVVWAPMFAGAILLFFAARHIARESAQAEKDLAVDFWAGAASLLALIGLQSLAPDFLKPSAMSAAALGATLLFHQRGWRGLGHASIVFAMFALAHALSAGFPDSVTMLATPVVRTLLILIGATAFLHAASALATPRQRDTGEALGAGAILIGAIAVLHALRWVATGGAGVPLDRATEVALNVLTLISAGFLALPRGDNPGLIARLRGHLLMVCGLAYSLLAFGLTVNPWWGSGPMQVAGPPLLNTLVLAYAAPAAIALAAAARLYRRSLFAGRGYAIVGGVLALIWVMLEIRYAFSGPTGMARAHLGMFEAHCYALAWLAFGWAIAFIAQRREAADDTRPFTHDLVLSSRAIAVACIAIAAFILLMLRHPWWGAQLGVQTNELSTSLSLLAQALAVAIALYIGRALSRSTGVERARFVAASAAIVFAWSFGHSAIRWLHHRAAMDDGLGLTGLEGFGHALWPLVLVLAGSSLTQRAPGRDTVRAYLHDLSAIWGAAIWPAMIWAALALWVVFNPWWGWAPAYAATWLAALIGLCTLALAAWFSAFAHQTPHIRAPHLFAQVARIAVVGHLFVALSLTIRRLYQGPDMRAALEAGRFETWTYSALWALYGASVLAFGIQRKDATLRWSGLALLLFVTAKVALFDTERLDGVPRVASLLALAVILIGSAVLAQRFRRTS